MRLAGESPSGPRCVGLAVHPARCCLLGVPGLQQLLRKRAQLGRISRGIDCPRKTLDFKLLANTEFAVDRHGLDAFNAETLFVS